MKISSYRIISLRKLSGQIFFDIVEKIGIYFRNHFYNEPNRDLIVDLNMKAAVAKLFRFWFYISIWRDRETRPEWFISERLWKIQYNSLLVNQIGLICDISVIDDHNKPRDSELTPLYSCVYTRMQTQFSF